MIVLSKDSCVVTHFESVRNGSPTFRNHPDSPYVSTAQVPGRYHVILHKYPVDLTGEPIYGFVEFTSNDFYANTVNGDIKKRVEYKGYFAITPAPSRSH